MLQGRRLMGTVEARLTALADMPSAQLRSLWTELTGTPSPRVSPKLMRLALAWEIQASTQGGLPGTVRQSLTQMARGSTRTTAAQAGMRLVREWNGEVHVVTVGEDKVIRWKDRDWRSLSEVVRAITGTRWSGPAFFGLKKRIAV